MPVKHQPPPRRLLLAGCRLALFVISARLVDGGSIHSIAANAVAAGDEQEGGGGGGVGLRLARLRPNDLGKQQRKEDEVQQQQQQRGRRRNNLRRLSKHERDGAGTGAGTSSSLPHSSPSIGSNSDQRSVIIRYKDEAGMHAAESAFVAKAGKDNSKKKKKLKHLSKVKAVAGDYTDEEIAALERRADIDYIEDDVLVGELACNNITGAILPRSPPQSIPYGIKMVQGQNLSAATDPITGEPIITVCIIDSGLDVDHEDIQRNFVEGASFGNVGPWFDTADPHGTHVAGILAALGRDDDENDGGCGDGGGVGVVGVDSGGNLRLLIARILDDDGNYAKASDLIEAAEWCADNGADVINMSLGSTSKVKAMNEAFTDLYNVDNVLMVAAAGNDGNTHNKENYPASLDAVISVGSVDVNGEVALNSQRNEQLELSAPGVAVLSTTNMNAGAHGSVVVRSSNGNNGAITTTNEEEEEKYSYVGIPMDYSPQGYITGLLVDCEYGTKACPGPPPSSTNIPSDEGEERQPQPHICLIKRGSPDPDGPAILFATKVKACEESKGVGAVIYNNRDDGPVDGVLDENGGASIPTIGMSMSDGMELLQTLVESSIANNVTGNGNGTGMVVTVQSQFDANYEFMSGTSMASPHVAGVAAVVWSHFPQCTNDDIRKVLQVTAKEAGDVGRDDAYGFGIVQAMDAMNYLAVHGCNAA